jgi:hypothetical protein
LSSDWLHNLVINNASAKNLFHLCAISILALVAACSDGGGTVGGGDNEAPATAAAPSLNFDTKTFRFNWTDVADATTYRLLEDPDGSSGFTQVGNDIPSGVQSYDHIVPLYARINARYILQSCNNNGCTDSNILNIGGSLVEAIGYFKASNAWTNSFFGTSVSLSADGNTLAVGAVYESSNSSGVNSTPNDDGNANSSGAVYVFTRTAGNWAEQAYIKASNPGPSYYFGSSVSLSADGNTLVVGADGESSSSSGVNSTPNVDGNADSSGAVCVFTRTAGNWAQEAYIKASNPGANDAFGFSVSLSSDGNTLAIGAYLEDSNSTGVNSTPNDDGTAGASGAAYVFTHTASNWTEQAYIKASNPGMGDTFGFSVSLSEDGNTLAVGANLEDSNSSGVNSTPTDNGGADDSGAAYVFTRAADNWAEQAYIKASNAGADDNFGFSVSLSDDGNTLAVGAYLEDSNTSGVNSSPNDDGSADNSGATYVFTRTMGNWDQQAYIKASNPGTIDRFGFSVSLSADGNTLAAGAFLEDSNSSGINSAPTDDGTAENSGAAYVFNRSAGNWTEQAYLKASNTGAGDLFGRSVNLSADGSTLAIGARGEDSNSSGVNSPPNDDGNADFSGAVYLY